MNGFMARAQGKNDETPFEHTGSDSGCGANLVCDDLEAAAYAARFWEKVEQRGGDECWPWVGSKLANGRGQFHIRWEGKKNIRRFAYAIAWELANGLAVPADCVVSHICDNPNCVNPTHLRAVSQAENLHDSLRKGRFNAWGIQKLNAEQVLDIRSRAASGETQKSIARAFGVARNTVSGIVNRKSWAHVVEPAFSNVERVATVNLPVFDFPVSVRPSHVSHLLTRHSSTVMTQIGNRSSVGDR